MSRWVRCSNGKRAGFVSAKIGIFLLSSKFFKKFLFFSLKKWFHTACERLIRILFYKKRYKFFLKHFFATFSVPILLCWLAIVRKQAMPKPDLSERRAKFTRVFRAKGGMIHKDAPREEAAGREPIYL